MSEALRRQTPVPTHGDRGEYLTARRSVNLGHSCVRLETAQRGGGLRHGASRTGIDPLRRTGSMCCQATWSSLGRWVILASYAAGLR
jgi:hypothetical protein